jgi:hypothetical protein
MLILSLHLNILNSNGLPLILHYLLKVQSRFTIAQIGLDQSLDKQSSTPPYFLLFVNGSYSSDTP